MGILYVVPTPIGNLEDITFRAVRVLKEVDLILAEDTRTSRVLLNHYNITNNIISHHKFNEHQTLQHVIDKLLSGENIALISDAGTPAISDPGFLLVRECVNNNIEVIVLPGPTAFVPAIVVSGLPNERFCFEGFLPQKKGRLARIEGLKDEKRTMVFYESPYRIVKTIEQFLKVFGENRKAAVVREISKIYEESKRGTLKELLDYFKSNEPKGEFVLVIAGLNNADKPTKQINVSKNKYKNKN